MAYSESLAQRLRSIFVRRRNITEKKMFGGMGFLLNGNMCVGIWKNSLIARIDPAEYGAVLAQEHVQEFDITGRPMKGWVMVEPDGIESDEQLANWTEKAVAFVSTLPKKKSPKKI
jgi:TfoX/Sxy family transcriptional regulator of competence genes